jgi:hypothetical protein
MKIAVNVSHFLRMEKLLKRTLSQVFPCYSHLWFDRFMWEWKSNSKRQWYLNWKTERCTNVIIMIQKFVVERIIIDCQFLKTNDSIEKFIFSNLTAMGWFKPTVFPSVAKIQCMTHTGRMTKTDKSDNSVFNKNQMHIHCPSLQLFYRPMLSIAFASNNESSEFVKLSFTSWLFNVTVMSSFVARTY